MDKDQTYSNIINEIYAFLKANHPMFNPETRAKFREYNKDIDDQISFDIFYKFIVSKNWDSMTSAQFEYNLRCFIGLFKDAHTNVRFFDTPQTLYWVNGSK